MVVQYLKIKYQDYLEERAFRNEIGTLDFERIDKRLKKEYISENPYRISKNYLRRLGEKEIHQYGETPLRTMHKIAKAAEIDENDHIYELGCGRGRTCFFLNYDFQCKVTGVERIGKFVQKAKGVADHFLLDVNFLHEDFCLTDFSTATVIYLYGTCLPDETIYRLCGKIPRGIKVISVSYPLSDYDSRFRVIKKVTMKYPWGDAEVFIQYG